ncbi:23S rRNA (pseudouridine(1915)-N(3))-methyltransferase RlmH [uncultured Desulfovibrio sp.]|uniref:23S rRNA (pseudouridine(1915)-N(3))-methyltransferase RlmH n=1 Tax=uncultured Desulfovibrio sp. TaxID=167968 RepID=UPI001B054119|nr:23S rRNA (pseudouridine(1915)-N(3))-methyltransferase RlmH [uncultured Desulfovibrio sp.]MBO5490818.1 23S rRNA (pseudouridine(1915)-N(3))-methyltransferase RlmH [Desulfovibrio sp.]
MAGKSLRCVCVGRLKTSFWKEAAAHYADRLSHWRRLELTDVRDGDAALPPGQRNALEGRRILEVLTPQDIPLVLDERGRRLTSPQLADLLRQTDEGGRGRACFIVGGAWGLDEAVLRRADARIRLSDMTLPHELARVVLLEQLYRAECILRKVPYHH